MSDLDVLVARLIAAGSARVYKFGEVPKTPPYPYAVLASSRMAPDTRTLNGSGNDPRRFSVQMFSKTADWLEDMADQSLTAFDAVFLTEFADEPQCRVEITTPPYRDPDTSGVLNVVHTFRF